MADGGPPGRYRRLLKLASLSTYLLVFALFVAVGIPLHANLPPMRSLLVQLMRSALRGQTRGQVRLGELERLDASGATLARLQVFGGEDEELLDLRSIRIHLSLPQLLAQLALAEPDATLWIEHLRVEHSSIDLSLDPTTGEARLVTALQSPSETKSGRHETSRPIALRDVELGNVHVAFTTSEDELFGARLREVRGSARLAGEATRVVIQRFGLRVTRGTDVDLRGTGSFEFQQPGRAAGTLHGQLDGVEVDLSAAYSKTGLELELHAPSARAKSIQAHLPWWPPRAAAALRLSAHGPLDELTLSGQLATPIASLDLSGTARLTPDPSADVIVEITNLDLAQLNPRAPPTSVEARFHAHVRLEEGEPHVAIEGEALATEAFGYDVPRLQVSARVAEGAVSGELLAEDPRGRLHAQVLVATDGSVDVSARLAGVRLDAVSRELAETSGQLNAKLNGSIEEGRFLADLSGDVARLRVGDARLETITWRASVDGTLDDLAGAQIEVAANGQNASLRELSLRSLDLQTAGSWQRLRFALHVADARGKAGAAQGQLIADDGITLRDVDARWDLPGAHVEALVPLYAPQRGLVEVDRLSVTGALGELEARGQYRPSALEIHARAKDVQLAGLASSLGLALPMRGRVSGQLSLTDRDAKRNGELQLSATRLSADKALVGDAELTATLEGDSLRGKFHTHGSPLGEVQGSVDARLSGRVHQASSWRAVTGRASLALKNAPLALASAALPTPPAIDELDGRLSGRVELERDSAGQVPNVFLQAQTDELHLGVREGTLAEHPLRFDDLTLHLSGSLDGLGGRGAASVLLTDARGELVTGGGTIDVNLERLRNEPEQLVNELLTAPVQALVHLRRRPISELPLPGVFEVLLGQLSATARVTGTPQSAKLVLHAQANQVSWREGDPTQKLDLELAALYRPARGSIEGSAELMHDSHRVGTARLAVTLPREATSTADPEELEVRGAALLAGLPLTLVPGVSTRELTGTVHGSVDVELGGQHPHGRAHLELQDIRVAERSVGRGRLHLEATPDQVDFNLRLRDGDRQLRVKLGADAAAEGEPRITQISGTLQAEAFEAGTLSPLLGGVVTGLTGAMDADLAVALTRPTTADPWALGLSGTAELSQTRAHVDALGLELRDVSASATASRDGEASVIEVSRLSATARASKENLTGSGRLTLRGGQLDSAEGSIDLDEVPLSLEGVSWGKARGRLTAKLERQPDRFAVTVDVPRFLARLPPNTTQDLIDLDEHPDVVVLQRPAEATPRKSADLPWDVTFHLGKEVRVTRGDLNLPLGGQPRLQYEDAVRPSGTVEALPGGRLTLFGESFLIERAVAQLVPEQPSNPRIELTASWQAPDGTTIYVDVTGSAKEATLSTRDDAGLDESERFNLLSGGFGSGEGSEQGNQATAVAISESIARLGINELLRDSLGEVSVRAGATEDNRTSFTASARLSNKLWFEGNFHPGAEGSGQDSYQVSGTLDYRFTPRWSLRTELGTRGRGAFDLLWSYRY